jgi:protein tyrosine phosphatase (PTP) superfamily phosphohydrolase (DUF442 family)
MTHPLQRTSRFAVCLGLILAASATLGQTVDLLNKKEPLPGITSGGQPTAEQLAAAAKAGVKVVIDLRTSKEDRGMDEKAVVEKLLGKNDEPVLLHCASGNRVGALLALRAKLEGSDNDAALALGVAGGVTGLKHTVEEKLAQGHD